MLLSKRPFRIIHNFQPRRGWCWQKQGHLHVFFLGDMNKKDLWETKPFTGTLSTRSLLLARGFQWEAGGTDVLISDYGEESFSEYCTRRHLGCLPHSDCLVHLVSFLHLSVCWWGIRKKEKKSPAYSIQLQNEHNEVWGNSWYIWQEGDPLGTPWTRLRDYIKLSMNCTLHLWCRPGVISCRKFMNYKWICSHCSFCCVFLGNRGTSHFTESDKSVCAVNLPPPGLFRPVL